MRLISRPPSFGFPHFAKRRGYVFLPVIYFLLAAISLPGRPDLTEEELAFLAEHPVITFVSQTRYPPFEFVTTKGNREGMCLDLARWMASDLGFRAEFRDMSFQEAQRAVLSGEADVLTSLFYSERRDETFEFTSPMFQVPATIFVISDRFDINDIDDLNGKRIAVQRGDYALEFLDKNDISFTAVETTDFSEATEKVIAGEADALIGDEQIVLYHVYQSGQADLVKRVGEPLYIGENCMAVNESHAILARILDKGIQRARETGVLEHLNEKWVGEALASHEPFFHRYRHHIYVGAGVVVLLVLLALLWNVRLRDLVARRTAELKRSEEHFRAIYNSVNDAVILHDGRTGEILEINPRACELFRLAPEQMLGKRVGDFVTETPPYSEREAMEYISRAMAGEPQVFEWKTRRPGGEAFWIDLSIRKAVIQNKEYALAVLRDITERKEFQAALEHRRREFEAIAQNSPDVIVRFDRQYRHLYISPAVKTVTGLDPAEFIGRTNEEVGMPGKLVQFWNEIIEKVFSTGTGHTFEFGFPVEGRRLFLEARMVPEKDAEGNVVSVLSVARDMTPRREAEKAIEERERILTGVSETADLLLRCGDFDLAIKKSLAALGEAVGVGRVYLFRARQRPDQPALLSQIYEWTREGVSSQLSNPCFQNTTFEEWQMPEAEERLSRGTVYQALSRTLPSPTREQLLKHNTISIALVPIFEGERWWGYIGFDECEYERKWSVAELQALRSAAGVIGSFLERRRAEQETLRAKEEWERTFDAVRDAIALLDDESRFVRVNAAFAERFAIPKAECLGRPCCEIFTGNHVIEREGPLCKSFLNAIPRREEIYDAKLQATFLVTVSPIDPGNTGTAGRVYIASDITDRKTAEDERRKLEIQFLQSQKLESLGILAGGIAHDFNNLLVGIIGHADLATADLADSAAVAGNLEEIGLTARRAAELCQQLLAYSGRGRFLIEHIDLNEIVREMVHLLEISISKKAGLHYHFLDDILPVRADATQIRQILMNLITNASESLGSNSGIIRVTTGRCLGTPEVFARGCIDVENPDGEYVYVEVSDTGCGMDPETVSRIFDPFFSTKFTGRGLGLAAVLGIVRGHKGNILITSSPGEGSTFRVLLPASVKAVPPPPPPAPPGIEPWSGFGTVLLVDDESTVLRVASAMLQRIGFNVITAESGLKAVRIFEQRHSEINLVILDLTMPEMDGEETFSELRRIRPDIRIVLSSGYNEQDVTDRFFGRGITGFIQKPYRLATFTEKLRQAMHA